MIVGVKKEREREREGMKQYNCGFEIEK